VAPPLLWNYDREDRNSNSKSGVFNHLQLEKKLFPVDCDNDQQPDIAIWTFWAIGRQFCYLRCQSLWQLLGNTFIELVMVENPEFAVRIWTLSVIDIIISGFGGHIATSGCRSSSTLYCL